MATSQYFSFALPVSFHPYSICIFILILLLSEAKLAKPWNLQDLKSIILTGIHLFVSVTKIRLVTSMNVFVFHMQVKWLTVQCRLCPDFHKR
jgi:hypothetical protein